MLYPDRLEHVSADRAPGATPHKPRKLQVQDIEDVEVIDSGFIIKASNGGVLILHGPQMVPPGGATTRDWQDFLAQVCADIPYQEDTDAGGDAQGNAPKPACDESKLQEIFDRCDEAGHGYITKSDLVKACQNSALIADFLGISRKQLFELGGKKFHAPQITRLFQQPDGSSAHEITLEDFQRAYRKQVNNLEVKKSGALLLVKGNFTQVQHFLIHKDRIEYFADAASAARGVGCRGRVWAHEVKAMRSTPTGFTIMIEDKVLELQVLAGDIKQEWDAAMKPFAGQKPDKSLTAKRVPSSASLARGPSGPRSRSREPGSQSIFETRAHSYSKVKQQDFRFNTHPEAREAGGLLHGREAFCLSARRGPREGSAAHSVLDEQQGGPLKINERICAPTPRGIADVADKITGARSLSPRGTYRQETSWLKITQRDGIAAARRNDRGPAEVATKIGAAHAGGGGGGEGAALVSARRCGGSGISGKITERGGRERASNLPAARDLCMKITDSGRIGTGWVGGSNGVSSMDKARPMGDGLRGQGVRGVGVF